MIKTAIASLAAAAAVAAPSASFAGPYINVEANSAWTGSNYTGPTTDLHIGYEGQVGVASYYVQGGPAIVKPDGGDTSTDFSGKAGLGLPLSESVDLYSEVSFLSADNADNGYGGKLGVKYAF